MLAVCSNCKSHLLEPRSAIDSYVCQSCRQEPMRRASSYHRYDAPLWAWRFAAENATRSEPRRTLAFCGVAEAAEERYRQGKYRCDSEGGARAAWTRRKHPRTSESLSEAPRRQGCLSLGDRGDVRTHLYHMHDVSHSAMQSVFGFLSDACVPPCS